MLDGLGEFRGQRVVDQADDTTTAEYNGSRFVIYIYKTGTTGPSKGVEVNYFSPTHAANDITKRTRFGPNDNSIICITLFHASIQVYTKLSTLGAGATVALFDELA